MSGGSPGSPSTHRALCCAPSARPTSSTVVWRTLDNSKELRMAVAMRLTAISRRACSWSRRASFVVTATVSCSEVAFGTLVRERQPLDDERRETVLQHHVLEVAVQLRDGLLGATHGRELARVLGEQCVVEGEHGPERGKAKD